MPNTATTTLSKTRFSEGFECPTKLYYRRHRDRYPCEADEDPFLQFLARGGFQVGALARLYYPQGILVDTLDTDAAERETAQLMARPHVVIFEAALRAGNLAARVDILVKDASSLRLIEVKSKSFEGDDGVFWKKVKGVEVLTRPWTPKLADVAFQTLVCRRACPGMSVAPFLMATNKNSRATVSGLHQKFRLGPNSDRRGAVELCGDVAREALGEPILEEISVAREVEGIMSGAATGRALSLTEEVDVMSRALTDDTRVDSPVGKQCRKCAYRRSSGLGAGAGAGDELLGIESGFEVCWEKALGVGVHDLRDRPMVLDMPKVKSYEKLMHSGLIFQDQLARHQVVGDAVEDEGEVLGPGLTQASRYWLQIEKDRAGDNAPYFDHVGLGEEMNRWAYPLHLIDFETMTSALPFHRGLRPYEMLAFQFSHHTLDERGVVRHQTQWLESAPGRFPNFDFARALYGALGDRGTVLCYSPHENTVLLQILRQLEEHSERPDDADVLSEWIRSLTIKRDRNPKKPPHWEGKRAMVDLLEVLKRFVLYPAAQGSCSLKNVLPACLAASPELRRKYSGPVYGSKDGLFSHNFKDMVWWRPDPCEGARDPYSLLEEGEESATSEKRRGADRGQKVIRHGPEAMAAFEHLQFVDISEQDRKEWVQSLYRYCELDTLAMVMLVESWRAEVAAHA